MTPRERRLRLQHILREQDLLTKTLGKKTKFDMRTWGTATACGTSACACGAAALDPVLQAEGLYFFLYFEGRKRIIKSVRSFNALMAKAASRPGGWELDLSIGVRDAANKDYMLDKGWGPTAAFFGLTSAQFMHCFFASHYLQSGHITPGQVADRLSEFNNLGRKAAVLPEVFTPEILPE